MIMAMDGDDSVSEDEWSGLRKRFSSEGLTWEAVTADERSLHLWRWLVDAEANTRAARHVSDKQRQQHLLENEEAGERRERLELETEALRRALEEALAGGGAVTALLRQEGLTDIAEAPLGEQVAYLLAERGHLLEEAGQERSGPLSDREKELTAQLIKASTELELSRRAEEAAVLARDELQKRVTALERTVQQLRMDNDSLAFKVSEAFAELEEKEDELRFIKSRGGVVAPDPAPAHEPPVQEDRQHPNSLPTAQRGSSNSPGEYSPPLSERISKRDHTDGSKTRPSRRTSNNVDPETANRAEAEAAAQREALAELRAESSALRSRLLTAEDRLEAALRNLELYRIKSRNRLQALRLRHNSELQQQEARAREQTNKAKAEENRCNLQEARCAELEREARQLQQERQQLHERVAEHEELSSTSETRRELAERRSSLLKEVNDQLTAHLRHLAASDSEFALEITSAIKSTLTNDTSQTS